MKPKTAIFLLVVLVACVGYVVIRHGGLLDSDGRGEAFADGRPIFGAEPVGEKTLTVAAAQARPIVFEKRQGQWRITAPVDAAAARVEVDEVAGLLRGLKSLGSFAPGDAKAPAPKVTGIDSPPWTVELVDDSGASFALEIGRPRPLSGGQETYVRVRGDARVHVVKRNFADVLGKDLRELRDKKVLDLDTERIVRVRADGPRPFELEKADDRWRLTRPVAARGDANAIKEVLGAVASVTAEEIVADRPASLDRYGLTPGREALVVRVWEAPKAPAPAATTQATAPASAPKPKVHALALGLRSRDQKKIYAKLLSGPTVFLLSADLAEQVQPEAGALRDKRVLSLDAQEVTAIDVQTPQVKLSLKRTDHGWRMIKPYAGEANREAVDDLLKKLVGLQAQRWSDPKEALPAVRGLAPPRGTILLTRKDGAAPIRLLLGAESSSGRMTFCRVAGSEAIAVIKSEQAAALAGPAVGYWHTDLFEMPFRAKVVEIAVTKPGGKSLVVRETSDRWGMKTPVAGEADAESIDKLIRRVRVLREEKVALLDAMVPNEYLKDKKLVTVELVVELPGPPSPIPTSGPTSGPASAPAPAPVRKVYVVRALPKDGKTLAWVRGEGVAAVGEFPADLYDRLRIELRGRTVWRIDPEKVIAIGIAAGQDRAALKRREDNWVCTSDRNVKIDSKKVAAFLKDLRTLRAERFYTHTPLTGEEIKRLGFDKPWMTLTLQRSGAKPLELTLSNKGLDKTDNRFARAGSAAGAFVIAAADLAKITKTLKDFEE